MSDILKVVTLSKGGGKQIIDVSKDTTYEDLEKQTLYLFFSKGRSNAQNRHAAVRPESFFFCVPLWKSTTLILSKRSWIDGWKFFDHIKTV